MVRVALESQMMNSLSKLRACLTRGLLAPILLLAVLAPGWAGAAPLEGRIEETGVVPTPHAPPKIIEPMPVPVVKPRAPLKGKLDDTQLQSGAEKDALSGQVDDSGAGAALQPVQGKPDPNTGRLKATVSKDDELGGADPDAADSELMVQWDRWRNRFLRAIQTGMQDKLNDPNETNLRWDAKTRMMVNRIPLGTVTWFAAQVTPDLRIHNAKIVHRSGYPGYDQAVLEAIHDLAGSPILRYPRGSRRQIVSQVAGIKTAETSEFRYQKFGDVERQIIPGDY